MKINKAIPIRYGLMLLLLALAFTNLFVFSLGGLKFSYFIVFGALFISYTTIIKGSIPPLNNSFPLLIFIYIILSSLLNFNSFRVTSVIYSFLFVIYFIYFNHHAKKYLTIENFIKVLKIILVSYFVVLIIAQLMVLLDIHELHGVKGYYQATSNWGIEYKFREDAYRYFSLSTEPSYASIIVLLTFATLYSFTENKRRLFLYAIITLYMLLSFKSAIGFILLFFYIVSQVKFTNKHFLFVMLVVLIGIILFFFTDVGGRSIERIRDIVFLVFTDFSNFIESLNHMDSSAYARIGPFIIYLQQVDFLDYHFYFGHGASTSDDYFVGIIYPEAWNKFMTFNPPFFPGFLYDYGMFGVLLVLTFLWKLVKSKSIFYKAVIFIMLLNSNLNTQLFWFVILMLTLTSFYAQYQYPRIIQIPKVKGVFRGKRFNI